MDAYIRLKQLTVALFERTGHKQVAEEISPDAFGSAYSIFQNGHSKIRLMWDGKDEWAIAQLFNPNACPEWQDIGRPLRKMDIENASIDPTNVEKFLEAIEMAAN